MSWVEPLAWAAAGLTAVPLLVLAVECLAALVRRRPAPPPDPATRPRTVVLIPAHDEEAGLARTLRSAAAQLGPGDRVLVVADNCTDETAAVARTHGAGVVERFDATRRGKGYALAFGRDALRANPPDVVIVLDADCVVGDDALARLATVAATTGRPAQAAYVMTAPPAAGPQRQVAAFAFLVKNVVRPLGLSRLGGPCSLTGTGMAFPWAVFADAPLADGHIAEDAALAVKLAAAGRPPMFVPDARVEGEFPVNEAVAATQRRRWVHGHLRVTLNSVPRLMAVAVVRGRPGLLAAALDIGVPPLTALLALTVAVLAALAAVGLTSGAWGPAVGLAAAAGLAVLGVAFAWYRFGRFALPGRSISAIPLYALQRVPLYFGYLIRPQYVWIRTQRGTAR